MDTDLHDSQLDWISDAVNFAVPAALEWDLADAPGYSLDQFARAVGQALLPHGICIRLDESRDGSRVLSAWRPNVPGSWHVIPVDFIRVSADGVDAIADSMRRNLDLALTD